MAEKLQLIDADKLPKFVEGGWVKLALNSISTCPKIKKEREIKILADRFGLGKSPKTLNAIGSQYNLTRERIRQIVNNTVKKISGHCVNSDLKHIITEIDKIAESKKGILTEDFLVGYFGITGKEDANALTFILHLTPKLNQVKESNTLRPTWVLGKPKNYKLNEVSKAAIELLKKNNKVMTVKEIATSLKEDELYIEAILEATKATMTTEDGKWGLIIWPHVNPKSIRDKSKFILKKHTKPLHYSELTEKISQMGSKNVTKQSVHNELIKNNDFVLIGRGIYALSEWGYTPGVVEEVIVTVLEEAGEPLHKNEIIKRVQIKRIVKDSTVVLNLQKNRFKRVAKAVYTLN